MIQWENDRMSEYVANRMPEKMSDRMSEYE